MTATSEPTGGTEPVLWVRSELMPTGTYGVGLSVGEDRAWVLTRDQAVAYVVACFARATEADHDAATYALLCHIGLPADVAAQTLAADIRPSRAADDTATAPLRFVPSLGRHVGPFLRMFLHGRPAGEVTPTDLREHAAAVLQVIAAADLDQNLHRVLVGQIGLDDGRARAIVGTLMEHWPEPQHPRGEVSTDG